MVAKNLARANGSASRNFPTSAQGPCLSRVGLVTTWRVPLRPGTWWGGVPLQQGPPPDALKGLEGQSQESGVRHSEPLAAMSSPVPQGQNALPAGPMSSHAL